MPESEPKPKLIELVGQGAGQGWKAVLRNGKAVVVHEIPVPPAEAQAAAPRLQRLYEHRHPALSPVLGWGTDQNGVWVATEPNEGTPLGSILSRGPLTPPAAAALGSAVLSGVAALHEAGIAMGGFGATAVRVTQNGDIRLAGHPAAAVRGAPSQSDLRADVRSSGMAVCAAFGVDPAGAPAPPNVPPGLVVTMRSMASGAMGPSADRAQGAFREMAAALLAPDRQVAAQSELATRAGGREVPKATPFLPGEAPPADQAPAPVAAAAAPAAAAAFTPAVRREETTARHSASYEAPDRPLQTYPSVPAYTFPPTAAPAPAAPADSAAPAAPAEPAAPVDPKTSSPAIPTWSEAPPRTEAPFGAETPPAVTIPPPPATEEPEPPETPASPFESASAFASTPPAPVEAPKPVESAPPPEPADAPKPTWTPVDPPVWKPGAAIPAETLGTGAAASAFTPVEARAEAPVEAPEPAAPPTPQVEEPPPFLPPAVAPVRQPMVPRPPVRGSGRPPSERPPWLIPAAVVVVIVILLGVFGVIVLAGRNQNPVHVAQTSPSSRPTSSPSSSAHPTSTPTGKTPAAVPSFGPASADPVTKVQFCTPATPCKIAVGVADETGTACGLSSCTIEVAIYFTTGQKTPVHYNLRFFDRCSGLTTDLPGPPAFTPPDYAVVIPRDKWQVNIPAGVKSGALVAVTDQPTTAASAPLLLGSQDSCA